jgi:hypothetical protein
VSTADAAVKAAAKTGLERLVTRGLPKVTYHLRAVEPEVEEAAREKVAEAKDAADTASWHPEADDEAREKTAAALADARAGLAACYEPIVLRALPPEDYEALAAEHKDDKDDSGLDQASLSYATFIACVQGGLPEAKWRTILFKQCSMGERTTLFSLAVLINQRATDGTVPKD